MKGVQLPDVVGFELGEAEERLTGPFEVTVTGAPRARGEATDVLRVVSVRHTPDGSTLLICAREVHDRPEREAE